MTASRFLDDVRIGHPNGYGYMPLRPVVDSIADHSMAPAYLLKELGIPELERLRFRLADGTVAEYGVGTANFEIEGRTRPCPVVFGPGDTPLLGDSTLQIFNLEYDPESNRLAPASNLIIGRVGVNGVLPKEPERLRPTAVAPREGYRIWLRYSDGTAGEVDLSHLVGKGGFQAWRNRRFFESVGFGESGAIAWGENIELCPDSLYVQLTGRAAETMMPTLPETNRDA